MSASMAEVVASHYPAYKWDRDFAENVWMCTNLECNFGSDHFGKAMEHVAEQLAANGYGKLEDAKADGWDLGYEIGIRDWPECAVACGACKECLEPAKANPCRRPE